MVTWATANETRFSSKISAAPHPYWCRISTQTPRNDPHPGYTASHTHPELLVITIRLLVRDDNIVQRNVDDRLGIGLQMIAKDQIPNARDLDQVGHHLKHESHQREATLA